MQTPWVGWLLHDQPSRHGASVGRHEIGEEADFEATSASTQVRETKNMRHPLKLT